MDIKLGFAETVRIGRDYPQCFDISRFGDSQEGIQANIFAFLSEHGGITRLEIRKKEHHLAVFLFKYTDDTLPEWWEDSELIYEQGNPLTQEETS